MIEANELLGSFDSRLREYAARRLTREGVQLVKGVVKEVREKEVELQARRAAAAPRMRAWAMGFGNCCQRSGGRAAWRGHPISRPTPTPHPTALLRLHTPAGSLWSPAGASCIALPPPPLQDGSIIPFGLCVWSTGVGPTPFVLRQAQLPA